MKKKVILCVLIIFIMSAIISCNDDLIYLDNENNGNEKTDDIDFNYLQDGDKPVENQNLAVRAPIKYVDGYLYYYNSISFIRYNQATNNRTSLCGDPLCSHTDMTCPLYSLPTNEPMYIYKNKIYFMQSYLDEANFTYVQRYMAYGIDSGKSKVLRYRDENIPYGSALQLYYDNYVYYYEYMYKDANKGGNRTTDFYSVLCRQNLTTGDIVKLERFDDAANFPYPIRGMNNKIYFADEINGIFYINVDDTVKHARNYIYNGKLNFKTHEIISDSKYLYYKEYDEANSVTALYRMSFDNGKTEKVFTANAFVDYYFLTDTYIYYRVSGKKVIGQLKTREGKSEDCIIVPHGLDIGGTVGTWAFNFIIGGLIGGVVIAWRLVCAAWYLILTVYRLLTYNSDSNRIAREVVQSATTGFKEE